MRFAFATIGFWLISLVASMAHGQATADPAQPVKPKVYALVAALGDQFSIVNENHDATQQSLPHIQQLKFNRETRTAPDNLLNILALQSLDKVVTRLEPEGKRIFISFGAVPATASRREGAVLAWMQAKLKELPQREEWHRILVATPAYRLFDHDGIASQAGMMVRLQGFGLFTQPYTNLDGRFKEDAISPGNKAVVSDIYIAPFSYVEIWILDPKDLSIIDRQIQFSHQKLADPTSGVLDLNQSVPKEFLAKEMLGVIDGAIHQAVMQSKMNDKRGVIDVGPIQPVNPDAAKK